MKPKRSFVTDFRDKIIVGGKQSYHTSDTSKPHLRFYGFYWPLWLMWARKSLKHPFRALCLHLLRTPNFVVWCFVVRVPSRKVSWHLWPPFPGHPSQHRHGTGLAMGGMVWQRITLKGLRDPGVKTTVPVWSPVLAYFSHRKNQELWGNKAVINPNTEYVKKVESKEGFTIYRF